MTTPGVRCSKCEARYECRENLLDGKPTWFPTCKHDSAWAEIDPSDLPSSAVSQPAGSVAIGPEGTGS